MLIYIFNIIVLCMIKWLAGINLLAKNYKKKPLHWKVENFHTDDLKNTPCHTHTHMHTRIQVHLISSRKWRMPWMKASSLCPSRTCVMCETAEMSHLCWCLHSHFWHNNRVSKTCEILSEAPGRVIKQQQWEKIVRSCFQFIDRQTWDLILVASCVVCCLQSGVEAAWLCSFPVGERVGCRGVWRGEERDWNWSGPRHTDQSLPGPSTEQRQTFSR